MLLIIPAPLYLTGLADLLSAPSRALVAVMALVFESQCWRDMRSEVAGGGGWGGRLVSSKRCPLAPSGRKLLPRRLLSLPCVSASPAFSPLSKVGTLSYKRGWCVIPFGVTSFTSAAAVTDVGSFNCNCPLVFSCAVIWSENS